MSQSLTTQTLSATLLGLAAACDRMDDALSDQRVIIAAVPEGCPIPRASHEVLFECVHILGGTMRALLHLLAATPADVAPVALGASSPTPAADTAPTPTADTAPMQPAAPADALIHHPV